MMTRILGGGVTLRDLHDRKGQELIDGVLEVVDRLRPLHLSLLSEATRLSGIASSKLMIPAIASIGEFTSRLSPARSGPLRRVGRHSLTMNVVVSIDGLQPEHDVATRTGDLRSNPENIAGQKITIHCTITGQMMKHPRLFEEIFGVLDPRARGPQGMVQLVHSTSGRSAAGNVATRMSVAGDRRHAGAAEGISQAGDAGGNDSAILFASTQSQGLYFCAHHPTLVGGPENQNRSLSIRRKSGLRVVRMRRIHGLGRHSRAQARRRHSSWSHLQNLHQDWPDSPRSTGTTANCRSRGTAASAAVRMKIGGVYEYRICQRPIKLNLHAVRELSARIGNNPLLTQASTGNTSIKLEGVLWIKASGKWMADALREDILIPLNLADVRECVKQKVDPAGSVLRVPPSRPPCTRSAAPGGLHVHCVNTIAWAVRQDAPVQLQHQIDGLRWQWIPYVPSGLPLAQEIEKVVSVVPHTDVLVLGNHGLVLGGDDCDMRRRSSVGGAAAPGHSAPGRRTPPTTVCWPRLPTVHHGSLPDDDEVHALGTDPISREILSGGFLYPCHAIFRPRVPQRFPPGALPRSQETKRTVAIVLEPFLIIDECGVVFSWSMSTAQRAMMSGLAQVIQRISSTAPIRYLAEEEVASSSVTASRYGELASASRHTARPVNLPCPKEVLASADGNDSRRFFEANLGQHTRGSQVTAQNLDGTWGTGLVAVSIVP